MLTGNSRGHPWLRVCCVGLTLMLACLLAQAEVQPQAAISDARIRLPLPGQTTAVVYLNLHNRGTEPLIITGVQVAGADAAELHEHVHSGGMMRMRRRQQVQVAPGQTVQFEPGGYHIMAFRMSAEPEREAFAVVLQTADGQQMEALARKIH